MCKSLAICLAIIALLDAGLWVRGQFVLDMFDLVWRAGDHVNIIRAFNYTDAIAVGHGKYIHSALVRNDAGISHDNSEKVEVFEWPSALSRYPGIYVSMENPDNNMQLIAIAHRTILVVSLAMFALFFRLGWKKRFPAGACPKCGYDLRATPDRCPECGTEKQPARC